MGQSGILLPLGELYQKRQQGGIQPYRGVGLRPQPYLEKQHLAGQRRIYRQLHEMESEQRRVWAHSLG